MRAAFALALAALALLAPPTARAQAAPAELVDRLDAYLDEAYAGSTLPGLAVALVTPAGTAYARTWGRANGAALGADTPVEIGSLTKSMTALVLLQLQQEGALSLTDPVVTQLPWFRLAGAPWAGADVTIQDLLAHGSGLPTASHGVVWRDRARIAPSVEEATRALATVRQRRTESGVYANMNYVVAAAVIEAATGAPWAEAVTRRVLAPLGMAGSAVDLAGREGLPVAKGHARPFGLFATHPGPGPAFVAPAGSQAVASLRDLAVYLHAWLAPGAVAAGNVDGASVVSVAAARAAFAPVVPIGETHAFGLGWQRDEREGVPVVFHEGATEGASAFLVLLPEQGLGFAILANAASRLPTALAVGLVDLALDRDAAPPTFDGMVIQGYAFLAVAIAGAATFGLLVWRVVRAARGRGARRRPWVHAARTAVAALAAGLAWLTVPDALRTVGVPLPFGIRGFTPELLVAAVVLLGAPTLWAAFFAARWVRDR